MIELKQLDGINTRREIYDGSDNKFLFQNKLGFPFNFRCNVIRLHH